MTPQEKKLNQVEARVSNLETKFEAFMEEMRDFKTEMRDRDNQRAAEIRELRQKQEADIKEIRKSIGDIQNRMNDMSKHFQNLTVAAMVGMGTAVIGIGAIAVTVMYSVFSR